MLKDALAGRVQILDHAEDWKKAVEMVIRPLQKDGVVEFMIMLQRTEIILLSCLDLQCRTAVRKMVH